MPRAGAPETRSFPRQYNEARQIEAQSLAGNTFNVASKLAGERLAEPQGLFSRRCPRITTARNSPARSDLPLAARPRVGHIRRCRRRGRVAEGGGLLNRYRVVKPYRGFESLRLRQPPFACASPLAVAGDLVVTANDHLNSTLGRSIPARSSDLTGSTLTVEHVHVEAGVG